MPDPVVVSSQGVHVPPDDDRSFAGFNVCPDVGENGVTPGQNVRQVAHYLEQK